MVQKKKKKAVKTPRAKTSTKLSALARKKINLLEKLANGDEFIDTSALQKVFDDCHRQTIYRYVTQGLLTSYRSWGAKSRYNVKEVRNFIIDRLSPRPRKKKAR